MNIITLLKPRFAVTLCAAALLNSSPLHAHGGATGIVKERMDQMVELKRAMKTLAAVYKGRVDYNASTVQAATRKLQRNAGDALTTLYPKGSLGKKSEARAEIWQQWEQFSDLAQQLKTTSTELQDAAAAQTLGRQQEKKLFKQIANTCSSCHDRYRIED